MKKQLRWKETACDEGAANRLHRFLRIPLVVAKILSSKELRDPHAARLFIESHLSQLDDPFKILNLQKAVTRVWQAMIRRESVSIFGDYDADGITSTALMVHLLRHFGIDVRYFVPRRFEEGYGLSHNVVERAYSESKPNLVIALDCGTNSTEEIEWMRAQGADVVIIDHHRANRELALNLLLVNPNANQENCRSTLGIFCTAGLVFKFSHGFLKHGRQCRDPRAASYNLKGQLDLVALATIADVVPLIGENRIFVKYGLKELQHPKRVGTKAIMRQAIRGQEQPLMASDISFKVCPRINASGRIADASLPVEMFLCEDEAAADRMATELSKMNEERQRIESEITREASQMVETQYPDCNSIVLYNDTWHTGVIGIVAGKLMQRYRKPCVVLSREESDMAKGSGRCVNGLNLVDLLSKCSHLLGSWGGHPLAAGIGMPQENVGRFRDAFEVRVTEALKIIDAGHDLEIAAWINVADIHETLMRHLRQLEPYGQENQQPIFGLRNVSFASAPHIFGNCQQHFNFMLTDGRRSIHGVAWHQAESLKDIPETFDAAVRLNASYWNGSRGIQVELVDFRKADQS
ncbi:MAG: single-stranded-DNA-specific exonuclease RecJ [Puniceicoccales bacterium]|jgi:single-stranded-DNA-specific exonuclease|nr:single-stranded-DNA-specific exonuclease RecJ [Puniceicoccales bacterium]